ncbi:autotransporter outer membrane beta-barrel domain-containing protein [Pseudomonas sp. PDM25]|uniref:autotransporter outer membrane beta-barrel domain-containing protein n=1 Tax=Pseudomonas sp. PDM25 TaxID=2854772 RepID=UPI001C493910|nr:autotransporter outer membrane beta-barrel domain-containing protein [Pseudomonas sp. PDM25]MBV7515705.1 autotransporter outer membrane beta-barrel domain-containing protein [Pseudomonas sp. PDM25]
MSRHFGVGPERYAFNKFFAVLASIGTLGFSLGAMAQCSVGSGSHYTQIVKDADLNDCDTVDIQSNLTDLRVGWDLRKVGVYTSGKDVSVFSKWDSAISMQGGGSAPLSLDAKGNLTARAVLEARATPGAITAGLLLVRRGAQDVTFTLEPGAVLNVESSALGLESTKTTVIGGIMAQGGAKVILNGAATISATGGASEKIERGAAGVAFDSGSLFTSAGGLGISAYNADGIYLSGANASVSGLVKITQAGGEDSDEFGGAGVRAETDSDVNLEGDMDSSIKGHRFGVLINTHSVGSLSGFSVVSDGYQSGAVTVESRSTLVGNKLSVEMPAVEGYAVYVAGSGSSATLSDTVVSASGFGAFGLYMLNGGELTFGAPGSGVSSVRTSGEKSVGVYVDGRDSSLVMSNTDVSTEGANSIAMKFASLGGRAQVTDSFVSTTGLGAAAISVQAGALTLQRTSITTRGDNSVGVDVSGGQVTIGPGVMVNTYGGGADGLFVSDSSALASIDRDTRIATHGENASAFSLVGAGNTYTFDVGSMQLANLVAERGSLIRAADGATVEVTQANPFSTSVATVVGGVPSSWGAIAGDGGTVQLDGGVSTNGNALMASAGGTLMFKGASSGANSIVQLDAGTLGVAGTLNATQHDSTLTLGALSGGGALNMGSAVTQLHLGSDQTALAGTFIFGGSTTGSVDLYKYGGNIQVLQGDAAWSGIRNGYLNGGVLQVRGIADPSSFTRTFYINDGWLDLSGTSGGFDPAAPDNAADWSNIHIEYAGGVGGVIGTNDKIAIADGAVGYQIGGDATRNGAGIYVVKNGGGVSIVTADNTYLGNTQINDGTLQVSRDANLGDTAVEREVRLQGGNLQISKGASDFQSLRAVQVLDTGSVIVDADVMATLGSIVTYADDANGGLTAGGNSTFTKDGAGALTVGGLSLAGGLVMAGGSLTAGGGEIFNGNGGAAIAAAGGTSLSVAHTSVEGGTTGVYRSTSAGMSTFNVDASSLKGDIASNVAGAVVNVGLSGGTELVGVISQSGGGQVNATVADASTVWNLTGDSSVQQLTNRGLIEFASSAINDVVQYKTLFVKGDYVGGGAVGLNTELNAGGNTQASNTDRVLISGNAIGTTMLHITTTGTAVNTNKAGDNKFHANEGISVAQIGGNGSENSFKLDTTYVTSPGSLYQYRLFGYGPSGAYGDADASQSRLSGGTTWDYRLQTAYEDDKGKIIPGAPTDAPPGTRPLVLPQTSSYLIAPLVLQRYSAMLMSGLHARLGDMSSSSDELGGEAFARTLGESGNYTSSRSFQQYGFDFDQSSQALQFGGNFLRYTATNGDTYRMGLAATIGSIHATPRTTAATSSDLSVQASTLALTGTWLSAQGWYADGVLGASFYRTSVDGVSPSVGRLHGTGLDLSVESGRRFTLNSGMEVEPHLQFMGQAMHYRDRVDADGTKIALGNTQAWTTGAGVRVSYPIYSKGNTVKPYADAGADYTWISAGKPRLAGQEFTTANVGGGLKLALGVSAQLSERLQVYGEANGQARPSNSYGNSAVGGNLGLRYDF